MSKITKVRRYHLRSLDSYDNMKDLVQNYIKYLYAVGLDEAWMIELEDAGDSLTSVVKKMLEKNYKSTRLIIRDSIVEAYAKDNEIVMVNEL